jgi:ketosteroid isomerase-like protein
VADVRSIAEAFSRHRFDEAYPYLHEDVRWTLVGDRELVGRDAVVSTCRQSAAYLAGVTSTFRRVRVVAGESGVVVDCQVDYTEPSGTSRISSCDLYEFTDGRLTSITSYTVPLPG